MPYTPQNQGIMTFLVFTRAGVAQESGLNVVILKALKLFCGRSIDNSLVKH